ncbi:MAG: CFI-box-CTERM domain-containing protein, partial [Pseudobdellovibrio sp.]
MSTEEKKKINSISNSIVEARKAQMWDMRVALIKHGHKAVQDKRYADAVVSYEKYIRILEIVFESKPGELSPQAFKESARTAEMSILAGIYWDLIRIYDTNPAYKARQDKVALQLARFAPLTPINNDLVRKAEVFIKTAKNPQSVKLFLSKAGRMSRCFIATSAFNSPVSPEVLQLRAFRDHTLRNSYFGRKFIYFYYKISPHIACVLDQHEKLKMPIRWVLRLVIKCVSSN